MSRQDHQEEEAEVYLCGTNSWTAEVAACSSNMSAAAAAATPWHGLFRF